MGQTRRAFRLALASWDIVSRDPALLVLPLMSAVSILTVMILLFVPAGLLFSSNHSQGTFLIFSLLAVYPLTLVGVFFRFAFVLVLAGRLDGRDTSIGDGLQIAWGRRASIASWAGIASVAAILIRGLRQLPFLGGLAGDIASGLLGIAWGAVTFFVVPVIAVEGITGRRAVERSASIFRERWGLEAVGVLSISGVFALAVVFGLAGTIFLIVLVHTSAVAVALVFFGSIVGLIGMMLAATAVQQAFGLVLYRYATGATLPAGFPEADLRDSVRPKRRRGLFRR
jgi:hypothetical protein